METHVERVGWMESRHRIVAMVVVEREHTLYVASHAGVCGGGMTFPHTSVSRYESQSVTFQKFAFREGRGDAVETVIPK